MSTEDVKEKSAAIVEGDIVTQKIRIMRTATVTLTILELVIAAILLAAGGTAIIASNIGIESLVSFRIPLSSIVGLTACLIVAVGAHTYTSMRHKELLVEQQIASSK
jgi:hypothetical protein